METKELNQFLKNFIGKNNKIAGKKLSMAFNQNISLRNDIINCTDFCPLDCPMAIRVRFMLHNIIDFPKYKNCDKNTKWNDKNLRIQDYCSRKCASSHNVTREKVRKTNIEKYGVSQIMKSDKFRNNSKLTCLNKYGVDNVSKLQEIKQKKTKTMLKNWGVPNVSQSPEIQLLKQQTCQMNYGTNFPSQNKSIFDKQQSTSALVETYKNSNLKWQGSYELYFLQLMDNINLIKEVFNGKTFQYDINNKTHSYHIDYLFRNINIEIKSTWFYNKNGKDIQLQFKNITKWETVRKNGETLIVLMSKKEIKKFVESIHKNNHKKP